jgi:hypothetical protein
MRVSVELLRPLVALLLCAGATAEADTVSHWYRGPRGNQRVLHVSLTVGLGLGFVASESLFKPALAPDHCRWCDPPAIDRSVRSALVWDRVELARTLSNITGYIATPMVGVGLTALVSLSDDEASWGRLIDDTIPVLETIAISQGVTQIVKWSVGRQRPFVHFTTPPPDQDDNLSFYSGHSALAFGAITSAGLIAHWRRWRIAPVIWGAGLPLALTTAYLRIAGDKHYFTDVATGTAVGVISGLTLPRLLRDTGVVVIPARGGVSVAGHF